MNTPERQTGFDDSLQVANGNEPRPLDAADMAALNKDDPKFICGMAFANTFHSLYDRMPNPSVDLAGTYHAVYQRAPTASTTIPVGGEFTVPGMSDSFSLFVRDEEVSDFGNGHELVISVSRTNADTNEPTGPGVDLINIIKPRPEDPECTLQCPVAVLDTGYLGSIGDEAAGIVVVSTKADEQRPIALESKAGSSAAVISNKDVAEMISKIAQNDAASTQHTQAELRRMLAIENVIVANNLSRTSEHTPDWAERSSPEKATQEITNLKIPQALLNIQADPLQTLVEELTSVQAAGEQQQTTWDIEHVEPVSNGVKSFMDEHTVELVFTDGKVILQKTYSEQQFSRENTEVIDEIMMNEVDLESDFFNLKVPGSEENQKRVIDYIAEKAGEARVYALELNPSDSSYRSARSEIDKWITNKKENGESAEDRELSVLPDCDFIKILNEKLGLEFIEEGNLGKQANIANLDLERLDEVKPYFQALKDLYIERFTDIEVGSSTTGLDHLKNLFQTFNNWARSQEIRLRTGEVSLPKHTDEEKLLQVFNGVDFSNIHTVVKAPGNYEVFYNSPTVYDSIVIGSRSAFGDSRTSRCIAVGAKDAFVGSRYKGGRHLKSIAIGAENAFTDIWNGGEYLPEQCTALRCGVAFVLKDQSFYLDKSANKTNYVDLPVKVQEISGTKKVYDETRRCDVRRPTYKMRDRARITGRLNGAVGEIHRAHPPTETREYADEIHRLLTGETIKSRKTLTQKVAGYLGLRSTVSAQ